jgi:pimeloyl-ACP methyl ester carboxylesterase
VEKPVSFVNRNGCRLFGMLYLPDQPQSRRVGILISVNAIKYRAGTFRLHVLLARKLCELGYSVFTFDPEGIGDSEGGFENKLLSEHYFDIQTGKYDNDVADAVDFYVGAASLDSLLLCGLCGGAISVLMGGADKRIEGMILLNIPVLVEDLKRQGREDSAAKITSTESASVLLRQKLKRLVDPNFWRRFVTMRVNLKEEVRLVLKSMSVLARKTLQRGGRLVRGERDRRMDQPVSAHRLFNLYFQHSFTRAMRAHQRVFFLFAEHDPWTWIFKSEFQDLALRPGNAYEKDFDIEVIGAANHIFSARDSQQHLLDHIVSWLGKNFPLWQPGDQRSAVV